MTEHTPGPWTVCKTTECGRSILGVSIDGGKNGFPIAQQPFNDRDLADAHLIAAAPDMLIVLREISNTDAKYCSSLNVETIRRVNAAIAKAEGAITQDKRGNET